MTILGNMLFLLTFKRNLHSMVEPEPSRPLPQKSLILRNLPTSYLSSFILLVAFILFSCVQEFQNTYFLHITSLMFIAIAGIVVPKHYISQDPILKFYVSVYHKQPPPILPWQLPENVDPNVKLIVTKLKIE